MLAPPIEARRPHGPRPVGRTPQPSCSTALSMNRPRPRSSFLPTIAHVAPWMLLATAACSAPIHWAETTTDPVRVRVNELGGGHPHLVVETENGSITVDSATPDETAIEWRATIRTRGDTMEAAREALDDVELVQDMHDGALRLGFVVHDGLARSRTEVRFEAHVPPGCDVEVRTANGRIGLGGELGVCRARTSNGRIEVEASTRSLAAETDNGRIRAILAGRPEGAVELVSGNGRIEARGAMTDLTARTDNGRILAELTAPDLASAALRTGNGRIEVALPRDASVRIEAETGNGKIHQSFAGAAKVTGGKSRLSTEVGDASGLVDLSTGNGSITIEAN
jgi:hypothetical protein